MAIEKYEQAALEDLKVDTFISSLKFMYSVTGEEDRKLKDLAVLMATYHLSELPKNSQFSGICKKNRNIGFDVLKASTRSPVTTFAQTYTVSDLSERCCGCREYLGIL